LSVSASTGEIDRRVAIDPLQETPISRSGAFYLVRRARASIDLELMVRRALKAPTHIECSFRSLDSDKFDPSDGYSFLTRFASKGNQTLPWISSAAGFVIWWMTPLTRITLDAATVHLFGVFCPVADSSGPHFVTADSTLDGDPRQLRSRAT
jgi:hypothetical protein